MAWTEEKQKELIELFEKGYSASIISNALGSGFTRNSVIGKLHRIKNKKNIFSAITKIKKIPSNPKQLKINQSLIQTKTKNLTRNQSWKHDQFDLFAPKIPNKFEANEKTDLRIQNCKPVKIMELKNKHCRYPVGGEGVDMLYCGDLVDRYPYCKYHHALVYVKPILKNKIARNFN